ncbi:hypothetical protein HD806DRAFT_342599 [Xylariaceae sp. AK1471]|nr:hypothetical protein HD806DRAFT_342599 [Xylariaceae sp. AK1471]
MGVFLMINLLHFIFGSCFSTSQLTTHPHTVLSDHRYRGNCVALVLTQHILGQGELSPARVSNTSCNTLSTWVRELGSNSQETLSVFGTFSQNASSTFNIMRIACTSIKPKVS